MYKKRIAILGSTGFLGIQALQVIRENLDKFEVVTLVAEGEKSLGILLSQIKEFRPRHVYIKDEIDGKIIIKESKGILSEQDVFFGKYGLKEISRLDDFDVVFSAMNGIAGLRPTYNMIRKKQSTVILANRTILVTGGKLIAQRAKKVGINIITLDFPSIQNCLQYKDKEKNKIEKLYLFETNPFLDIKDEIKLKDISKYQKMDGYTAVNKATMMDAGYRLLENMIFFNLSLEQVEIVSGKNPEIHSEVLLKDGTIKRNLCSTDIKKQISNALSWSFKYKVLEECVETEETKEYGNFEKIDVEKFPCLKCVYEAAKIGLDAQIVMNAANEVATSYFLEGKIGIKEVYEVVHSALKLYKHNHKLTDINSVYELDMLTRMQVEKIIYEIRIK